MNKLDSINKTARLYVMQCGGGFSCYGFAVLDRKARAVAQWLSDNGENVAAVPARVGTKKHYNACGEILAHGAQYAARSDKRCNAELIPQFIGHEGQRVECTLYGERVRFYIGKSSGWMPSHLEIKTARSSGGSAISADAVKNIRFI